MATRFEKNYVLIKEELASIKESNNYDNDSAAFGHYMLKLIFGIPDDKANECMTDGSFDQGLDAIYIPDDQNKPHLHFFQFKFPASENNINSAVSQEEVLKVLNGYEYFVSNDSKFKELKWNELLKEKRRDFLALEEYSTTIWIIRYGTGIQTDNVDFFYNKINELTKSTGNKINSSVLSASEISNYYEKSKKQEWPTFSIQYKKSLTNFSDDIANISSYYVSICSIYDAIKEVIDTIFAGNVRYYDSNSTVNTGIRKTLELSPEKFHILNNGITISCSEIFDNNSKDTVKITNGSIINGAQTVGTINSYLSELISNDADISKFSNSYVNVKIIKHDQTSDLLDQLVYTLNTQNQMRSSYSIANDPAIQLLQKKVNENTIMFLQLKNNEFNFIKNQKKDFNKLVKNIIDIETAVQCVVAYKDIDGNAHLSKNSKGALFSEDRISRIVEGMTYEDVMESYKYFSEIMQLITSYRAFRKDSEKKDIINNLAITVEDIDDYKFLTTGNYLILYSIGYCNLKTTVVDNITIKIINLLSKYFKDKENISNLTKSKDTFEKIREFLSENIDELKENHR